MRHFFLLAIAIGLLAVPVAARAESCEKERILQQLAPRHVGDPLCLRGLPGPAAVAKAAASAHAPPPPPPEALPSPGAHLSTDLNLLFEAGSADLTADAKRHLDVLSEALAHPELAQARFLIEGHTDTVGDRATNQALSERRAAEVVRYLVAHGIDAGRLQSVGRGQDGLLVPTSEQVPEPRNRRVHVVNLDS